MIVRRKLVFLVLFSILIFPIRVVAQVNTPSLTSTNSQTPFQTISKPTPLEMTAQFFQILTGMGTVYLLFQSFSLTKRLKKADVLLEFYRRYDQLVTRRERLNSTNPRQDSIYYYESFWNLHNDEFNLWRDGYIDDKTYRIWLDSRHAEYHSVNNVTGNMNYKEGWDKIKEINKDADFLEAMDKVFKGHAADVIATYKNNKYKK